ATFVLGTPSLLALWLGARADRARAEAARSRAIAALDEAEAAHRQAEAARGRAERTRDRALSAVRSLLGTEIGELLTDEVRPLRKALTQAGLHEARELVAALEGDPQAETERVNGYLALAGVQHEAGESAAAVASARRAVELAEALVARRPSAEARSLLGHACHRLSGFSTDREAARSYARRSNAIYEALRAEQPDPSDAYAHVIALNDYNIGHNDYADRRLVDAIA